MISEIEYAERLSCVKNELKSTKHVYIYPRPIYTLCKLIKLCELTNDTDGKISLHYHINRFIISHINELTSRRSFDSFRNVFMNQCEELERQGCDGEIMEYYKYIFPRNLY